MRITPSFVRHVTALALLGAGALGAGGCTSPMVRTADAFRAAMDADDHATARRSLADDPRTWFGSREGPGDPWTLGGGRWKTWDETFRGTSELGPWHVGPDRVFAVATEDNDYYRAIERSPSPWLLTYFFDDAGRISGRMISPVPDDLAPATPRPPDRGDEFDAWLRTVHPEEYEDLRPGGTIDPTGDRAARTKALLAEWRRDAGLPPLPPR